MTLKIPTSFDSSKYAQMCLLLDGAPPPGDATGCEPRIDPKTSEMSWDDFRMQLKNQEVNSITLQWSDGLEGKSHINNLNNFTSRLSEGTQENSDYENICKSPK